MKVTFEGYYGLLEVKAEVSTNASDIMVKANTMDKLDGATRMAFNHFPPLLQQIKIYYPSNQSNNHLNCFSEI